MNSRPQSERLVSWAGKGEIITEDATCRVFGINYTRALRINKYKSM